MPGEDLYSWSTTAATNANADTAINWAEGQPRASVNNSARSVLAAIAKFRDLLKGTIVTTGTANAQAFVSPIGYTTAVPTGLRALLKIGPGLTNTGVTTLSMDGIAAAPVKNKAGGDLIGGELVAGGYIEVIYDGTNWILAADGKEKVNRSGDTMTGDLTVPNLTAGSITAVAESVSGILCQGLTCNNFITTVHVSASGNIAALGSIEGGSIICDGFLTTQHVSASGNIAAVNLTLSGTGAKPGGGLWADSSDARIKNVVGDYTSGLAAVKMLNPVCYAFKGNDDRHTANGKEYIGLVAQDVETVMAEMVTKQRGTIDGQVIDDLRMLDPSALVFALVNCVKELSARIEALEAAR